MKWLKTLEKFKEESFEEVEKRKKIQDQLKEIETREEIQKEKETEEISSSYIDDQGIVHIEDWDQY